MTDTFFQRLISFVVSQPCYCRYIGDGEISSCERCWLLETEKEQRNGNSDRTNK
jgi:hypothetical protein